MRILVTGGAGLLGAAFARRMLAGAHTVTVADAFSAEGDGRAARGARAAALKEKGALVRRVDLAEADTVRTTVAECRPEVVVNAARLPADASVEPLLEAAKAENVALLVHVSDSDLYGPPALHGLPAAEDERLEPGDDARLLARAWDEEAVRRSGLPFVIFRCFELVAPGMPAGRPVRELAEAVLTVQEVPLSDHEPRDFLDVEDAARALHLAVARKPAGRTLNLGSGVPVTWKRLAEEIAAQAGLPVRFGPAPPPARAPRVADRTAAWEALGFGAEVPLARLAAALAERTAAPASRTGPPRAGAPPVVEVSRRDLFGIFRRPFRSPK